MAGCRDPGVPSPLSSADAATHVCERHTHKLEFAFGGAVEPELEQLQLRGPAIQTLLTIKPQTIVNTGILTANEVNAQHWCIVSSRRVPVIVVHVCLKRELCIALRVQCHIAHLLDEHAMLEVSPRQLPLERDRDACASCYRVVVQEVSTRIGVVEVIRI